MLAVAIYIKDVQTGLFNRVDLFDDEKISVVSSIQNINDISKTFTDFSQTFTVPASKQNNKIFRHWYDNSNDEPFSTLVKADAYIEIDTITFRRGKIQLESANVEDGLAKDYSITFIGLLGNLKDTFAGLYLKDLTSTTYDFEYTPAAVGALVIQNAVSDNVMFPLISSKRNWILGSATGSTDDINNPAYPIRYNELFPALRLRAVFNMIEERFGINFDGTTEEPSTFLTDPRFLNAYLWLKNREEFNFKSEPTLITYDNQSGNTLAIDFNLANDTFIFIPTTPRYKVEIYIVPTVANIVYTLTLLKNDEVFISVNAISIAGSQYYKFLDEYQSTNSTDVYKFVISSEESMTFGSTLLLGVKQAFFYTIETITKNTNQTITVGNLLIRSYFPEIKIEDFFSGILKMFNLTCFSNDGINYTLKTIDNYYYDGSDVDITKYVIQDKKTLNRVKTHKKINFDYEKSESRINVAFESNAGIPYGSLHYSNNPPAEGEEYSIKLPFEDLNFQNLLPSSLFQVGYALKTDLSSYIPKPIILYDYNPTNVTTIPPFYWSNSLTGDGASYTTYKAFGQETLIGSETYGLNFNEQQSTLTNEIVQNGLYQTYYSQYFANIFNFKARLTKISAILPTSILTTLKLNDTILIRDTKYLINTMTTDLTSGVAQFELLTDQRIVEPIVTDGLVLNLDAGNPLSYPGTGTTWTDLTTNGNNGTLINGPTFDSANGGSIVFDGTNDYVNCGNASNLQITVGTISAWVKTTTPGSSYRGIITKAFAWGLFVKDGILITYDWGMPVNMGTRTTGINISDGTWKNITMTFTETVGTPSNNAIVYLNGNPVLTTTIKYVNNTISVELGRNGSSPEQVLNGNISQALIGNRVLTPTEVLANFNATKGRYGL
jgi:hypothetical protein